MRAPPARSSSRPRAGAPAAGAALALAAAACAGGAAAPRPAPAAPVPVAALATTRTCADAAAGLEGGTRGVRAPGTSVRDALRARCADDGWSPEAIECFAAMDPDELARCAALLERPARDRLFDHLGRQGDGAAGPVGLALARARLDALSVGIPACDRFIDTVSRVLACDAMSLEVRAQLAAETADMWSLPVAGLSPDAQQRMIDVCSRSTVALEQHAADAGCAP